MAEIVIPAAIRRVLVDISYEPIDIARTVQMDQGEVRRRARFRTVARVATVSWMLNQAAFDAFWSFYENDLIAGQLQFDLQLARFGAPDWTEANRLVWFTAQFAEPPQYECIFHGLYTVRARLMLFGEPIDLRASSPIAAGGTDGDTGFWRIAASAVLAGGTDVDGSGWLFLAENDPARAGGTDGDVGGWLQINLQIRSGGTDGDGGLWLWPNGVLAQGADVDLGSWTQLSVPSPAGGTDTDGGGWTSP